MTSKHWLLLLALLASTGCARRMAEAEASRAVADVRASRAMAAASPAADIAADSEATAQVTTSGSEPVAPHFNDLAVTRKLIRNGTLVIEVESAPRSAARVEAIATEHGGYLSGLQGGRDGSGRRSSTVSVRVPAETFTVTMQAIRELGVVETDQVSTQDVGKEYADLEARLRTKQAVADRMREILATKTASLDDLFRAESQLASVLEQIEQLEGQRRYYDNQVALSTITATVHEHAANVVAVAPPPPSRFWQPAREAFATAREHLSAIVGVVVYLTVVAGPWVAIAALALLLTKRLRRAAA